MKSGFSSLELIMVMMVSAIMMTSLLQIYNQVTRNMNRVDRFVYDDTQILALKNRFGKDLAGLSAVWFTQEELKNIQKAQVKNDIGSEKQKKSNYFYSINKDGHLDILTFITTNPIQSYVQKSDKFVRVVYKVEKDPSSKGMFRLMRKEIYTPTENIDEDSLKQGRFYELVRGFASLEMTYQLIDKIALQKQYEDIKKIESKGESGRKDYQVNQQQKPIIRSVKKWDTTDIIKDADNKSSKKNPSVDESEDIPEDLGGATVPKFVEMKIVFGAIDKHSKKEYQLGFYIPSTVDNVPKGMLAIKKTKKAQTAN